MTPDAPQGGDMPIADSPETIAAWQSRIAGLEQRLADAQARLGEEVKKTDAIRSLCEPHTQRRDRVVEMVKDALTNLKAWVGEQHRYASQLDEQHATLRERIKVLSSAIVNDDNLGPTRRTNMWKEAVGIAKQALATGVEGGHE